MADGRVARLLELSNARTRVRIAPELGGAVADMDARLANGDTAAVLRPWGGPEAGLFGVGMNLLAPFSNRISGGGFSFDGTFHRIYPNLDGEAFPIHGDAFQRAWTVVEHGETFARLALEDGRIGPFRYSAEVLYRLKNGVLSTTLAMTNSGPSLPYGGGFHPWFPRRETTRLRFQAQRIWLEDDRHLPTDHVPLGDRPDWDFGQDRTLPDHWINNAFTDWDGTARIEQPEIGIAVTLRSAPLLGTVIVYSPDAASEFFCFEPVSHSVDAINQPGRPGLVTLAPGDSLEFSMTLGWDALGEMQ
jgi:aldose 1-epimerase